MDINITGNPGTGNTFQEIHIDTVQNYNPNATTVINNNYGDKQKPAPATEKVLQDAEREQRKAEIMDYVAKLKNYVAKDWKNRYESLWKEILALPEVNAEVYEPGRQQGTTFNRNLIANILYIMSFISNIRPVKIWITSIDRDKIRPIPTANLQVSF